MNLATLKKYRATEKERFSELYNALHNLSGSMEQKVYNSLCRKVTAEETRILAGLTMQIIKLENEEIEKGAL